MTNGPTLNDIPMHFRERFTDIIEVIDSFCDDHLNEEYKDVCHELAAHVCQDGSPLLSGKAKSWAAGVIWAIGRVNFLSDRSFEPHMTQGQFAKAIGVSQTTVSAKCREIWDGMELMQLDPGFTVASRKDANPLVRMAKLAEMLSIPHLERPAGPDRERLPIKSQDTNQADNAAIFTLRVELLGGMHCEDDWMADIEIQSSFTLEDLHLATQEAVGFSDDHCYCFYVARTDRSRDRVYYDDENGLIFTKTLDEVFPLPPKKSLFYLFDFGDDWIFKITKSRKAPHDPEAGVAYPRVANETGSRPTQYPSFDEDEE